MLKFTVIGDFHYEICCYPSTVDDIDKIVEDSHQKNVDFILHLGDFCCNYKNSPEVVDALLNNKYNIPVFGVMGNHEIQWDNKVEDVIDCLTNREVVFGEPIYNETKSAHYYVDIKDFRLIGTDTNFVYSPERDVWERKMKFIRPEDTILDLSLAPLQLEWLEKTIADAAAQNKKVIVASHAGFIGDPWLIPSPDTDAVQAIFAKYPKTVLTAINGHTHKDNFEVRNGVAYFDVNAARFGTWIRTAKNHYEKEHTFPFTVCDKEGKRLGTIDMSYRDITMGPESWFYQDAVWATLTLTEGGHITIDGQKSEWAYGLKPDKYEGMGENYYNACHPYIADQDAQVW